MMFRQMGRVAIILLGWHLGAIAILQAQTGAPEIEKSVQESSAAANEATNNLGDWIWAAKTFDSQTCRLWRSFEIPATSTVTRARLRMTVDNEYILYLDGRELGRGAEWRELYDYNLTPLISPGRHIFAVKAFNSFSFAGMLFGLHVEFADGKTMDIKSDPSWRIVPDDVSNWETKAKPAFGWPAATVIAPFGGIPWWTTPINVNKMPTLKPIKYIFWQSGWFQITLASVCGIVILISLRLIAQLAFHEKERWLLQRERARLARDIHDDLGSRMTQLVLHGEVAQSELPAESKTRHQIDRICEEARDVLSTVDEILWAVNPRRDTLRDFTSFVCGYAQEYLKSTSIQCLLEVDPEMSSATFDLPLRRSLLLAIKETLNNAVKYSEATELLLQIQWQKENLIVVVHDNGKGFDPAKVNPDRNGLTNMARRMSELGGRCVVTSEAGKGCRIEFDIPLTHRRRRAWDWLWSSKQYSENLIETKNPQASEVPVIHDPIQP
jgi:signal transduction histidine kinase